MNWTHLTLMCFNCWTQLFMCLHICLPWLFHALSCLVLSCLWTTSEYIWWGWVNGFDNVICLVWYICQIKVHWILVWFKSNKFFAIITVWNALCTSSEHFWPFICIEIRKIICVSCHCWKPIVRFHIPLCCYLSSTYIQNKRYTSSTIRCLTQVNSPLQACFPSWHTFTVSKFLFEHVYWTAKHMNVM